MTQDPDVITGEEIDRVAREMENFTSAEILQHARSVRECFPDDKSWASHNQIATLVNEGAEVLRKDKKRSEILIRFDGLIFIHVCGPGSLEVCGTSEAKNIFE